MYIHSLIVISLKSSLNLLCKIKCIIKNFGGNSQIVYGLYIATVSHTLCAIFNSYWRLVEALVDLMTFTTTPDHHLSPGEPIHKYRYYKVFFSDSSSYS